MTAPLVRVCVTGPESTGKTTLAAHLASELVAPCVPEAARLYAERVGRELTRDDVVPIGREHVAMASEAESGRRLVVLDTDLLSTIAYGRYYYGFESPWLDEQARERLADVYLLCDIDTPWIADGIRDRPAAREPMLSLFSATLAEYGAKIVRIRGSWSERYTQAISAVLPFRY